MALERDPLSKRLNTSSSKRPGVSTDSLLDHVPLLNILSPQDRQRILPELSETRYGKDDFIFREGDPTEYFHIVKEGTVKCVKSTANGKECTLKMLMPGDLFCCDAAAFDGGCHPGTAQPMVSFLTTPVVAAPKRKTGRSAPHQDVLLPIVRDRRR